MASQPGSGKSPRAYRSTLRVLQAEATRIRVVAAAAQLLATEGYARTTFTKVASVAGVSAETVRSQGPKTALMIAAFEYTALAAGHPCNRDNTDRLLVVTDREEAADALTALHSDVFERIAPLALALLRAASSESELAQYQTDMLGRVDGQLRRVLSDYRDRGWMRDDVSFDELVETTSVLCSMEAYLQITHRSGWTLTAYRAWLRRMLGETEFLPTLNHVDSKGHTC